MSRKNTKPNKRKGAAVAELAVCLPAIILLVMGAIECTSMIFLRQSLAITAYEGIRVAIRNDSTPAEVQTRCDEVLAERNIVGATITLTPAATDTVPRGQNVLVEVTAPCGANSILPLQFFSGDLQGTANMIKE